MATRAVVTAVTAGGPRAVWSSAGRREGRGDKTAKTIRAAWTTHEAWTKSLERSALGRRRLLLSPEVGVGPTLARPEGGPLVDRDERHALLLTRGTRRPLRGLKSTCGRRSAVPAASVARRTARVASATPGVGRPLRHRLSLGLSVPRGKGGTAKELASRRPILVFVQRADSLLHPCLPVSP